MGNRDRIFGLLAVVAVVIYMLACGTRPAWSPDSRRVVFAFADRDSQTSGLALYDLQTKQTKRIFETGEQVFFQPLWLAEKQQLVSLAAQTDNLDIIHIDLATGKDQFIKSIPAKEARTSLMVPPVLVDNRYLFFSFQPDEQESEHTLHRFDLETAQLKLIPDSTDLHLFQAPKGYLYLTGKDNGLELGIADIKKLRFRKLLTLDDEKIFGGVGLGLACRKDGSQFALIAQQEDQGPAETAVGQKKLKLLIIDRRGKLLKEIPLAAGHDVTPIAHMVYAPDEHSLFVAIANPESTTENADRDAKLLILELLEVDIDKGRFHQLIEVRADGEDVAYMQPSISPDGKYLAVDVLLPKDEKNSLLCLVDLTSPQRKVTKVSLPPKPLPPAAAAEAAIK